jgi:glycosyltransferase involved in cell wall biosynthesis
LTTPPLLSAVGLLVQKLRGAQHQIWEMDLYPDVAIDLQVLRAGSVASLITGAIADFVRRRANRIIVLGECMRTRLEAHGIPANQIAVAENWADGRLLYPAGKGAAKVLTVMYPGNLGLAHDVDTLAGAMRELGNHPGIRFLLVGGGPRFKSLQQFCESGGIRNTSFLPYCSRDRLNQLMAAVQVGLATQTDACLGSLVPSKIYSLIAAGLPLLFIGPVGSTAANLIQRFDCGWHVRCGDSRTLSRLLARLADDRDEVREKGRRARSAFLENYDRPIGVERICRLMGMPASVESALARDV